jgi:2-amino-4-hydroxy-6-hydroxymethyldihydropteridine diphosphokinase
VSVREPLRNVYIGLGSNIRPEIYLPCAINTLAEYTRVAALSHAWETPPYGMSGENFLNAAAHLQTSSPANILKTMILRRVEALLGRVRTAEKFSPRTIDLDILVIEKTVIDPDVWIRPHLAIPLSELIPTLAHPASGESLQQAARRLLAESPQMRVREDVFPFGYNLSIYSPCEGPPYAQKKS